MRTVLYDRHCSLGAKIVPFAGWDMPVQYKGVIVEHMAVRNHCGIFDVSHMGMILVSGLDAEHYLDFLSTNLIIGKKEGTSTYTVLCNDKGMPIDDVLIFRKQKNQFFVVVNAANRQKDLAHLNAYKKQFNVTIEDLFDSEGIIALQGPNSQALLSHFIPEIETLKPKHFIIIPSLGQELIVARTGYTGSDGFEIYAKNDLIVHWWDKLLDEGKKYSIEPAGLGARDTLRLEMGYALYGHELNETIAPNESVAAWTIKWNKEQFLGKEALTKIEQSNKKRHSFGIKMVDKGIARENYPVFYKENEIGFVTSGSFSPILNQGIALILSSVSLNNGDIVDVQIRQNKCQAQVVPIPFVII